MNIWRRGALLLLLAVGAWVGRAEQVDKLPKPTSYVSDFANVFDSDSKQKMEALCAEVRQKANADIAVVTVNDLGGEEPQVFAHELQQKWGIGTKPEDRGLLMLFAVKDKKRWIEVGFGLEGILNDAKVGDIGRSMVPDWEAGEQGQAALGGLQQIAKVIADDKGVTLDATPPVHTYHREAVRSSSGWTIGRIIWLLVIVVFIFGASRHGGGSGGGSGWGWFLLGNMLGGGNWSGGGRDRDDSWGGGGGGGGGGDGGGFGGFGGGDSGGGGAGGDL